MAQHRTRQQKIHAQLQRTHNYSLDQIISSSPQTLKAAPAVFTSAEKKPLVTAEQLRWLRKDFGKTAFAFMVVLLSMAASWLALNDKIPFLSTLL